MWPPTPEQIITMLSLGIMFTGLVVQIVWVKRYKDAKQAQLIEKNEHIKTQKESKDALLAQKDEQIAFLEQTSSGEALKIIKDTKELLEDEIKRLRDEVLHANSRADAMQAKMDTVEILSTTYAIDMEAGGTSNKELFEQFNISLHESKLEAEKAKKSREEQLQRLDAIGADTAKISLLSRIEKLAGLLSDIPNTFHFSLIVEAKEASILTEYCDIYGIYHNPLVNIISPQGTLKFSAICSSSEEYSKLRHFAVDKGILKKDSVSSDWIVPE